MRTFSDQKKNWNAPVTFSHLDRNLSCSSKINLRWKNFIVKWVYNSKQLVCFFMVDLFHLIDPRLSEWESVVFRLDFEICLFFLSIRSWKSVLNLTGWRMSNAVFIQHQNYSQVWTNFRRWKEQVTLAYGLAELFLVPILFWDPEWITHKQRLALLIERSTTQVNPISSFSFFFISI